MRCLEKVAYKGAVRRKKPGECMALGRTKKAQWHQRRQLETVAYKAAAREVGVVWQPKMAAI
jgi:hypothetical protein